MTTVSHRLYLPGSSPVHRVPAEVKIVCAVVAVFAVALAFGVAQPALAATVAASVDAAVRGVALGIATLIFLVGGGVGSALVGGLGPVLGYSRSLLLLLVLPVTGLVLIHHQNSRATN